MAPCLAHASGIKRLMRLTDWQHQHDEQDHTEP